MTGLLRFVDATLGRLARHFFFICLRSYFGLFYNISISNKHLLQTMPGGLILATHVTRLDGPMVASLLYPTRRVQPAVHYNEYYHPAQFPVLAPSGCIPLSSPKEWPAEKRAERKEWAQGKLNETIQSGNIVLLFPGGQAKRQEREIIQPHFSGAYETLRANPGCPVAILRIQGLSKFDLSIRDLFWSFIGIKQGRRHVSITIERLDDGLDTSMSLEAFNADLEERFNAPPHWPEAETV
jgi:1-acyl-sn-glycerol-3-phosphate acyltransferase